MIQKWVFLSLFAAPMLFSRVVDDAARFRNHYKLDKYEYTKRQDEIRIVVLDRGCVGFVPSQKMPPDKKMLPDSAACYQKAEDFPEDFESSEIEEEPQPLPTEHGVRMAQDIWEVMGARDEGPEIRIVAVGMGGLEATDRGLAFAKWWKADVVLFAQSMTKGWNRNGTGPLNLVFNKYFAENKQMIGVVANGNFAGMTYVGHVDAQDGHVRFGNRQDLRVRLIKNTQLQVELAWNSQDDNRLVGKGKDLNLEIYDEDEKTLLAKSEIKQPKFVRKNSNEQTPGKSPVPFEFVNLALNANAKGKFYHIKVTDASGNFDYDEDELTVAVRDVGEVIFFEGLPIVEFIDASPDGFIPSPADSKYLLAIGDVRPGITASGPTTDGRPKPDFFILNSAITYNDGKPLVGTSNASAIFTALVAILKAHFPDMTVDDLKKYGETLPYPSQFSRQALATSMVDSQGRLKRDEYQMLEGRLPRMFSLIKEEMGTPAYAARYQDQGYVVAYRHSPARFFKLFPNFKDGDEKNHEFYVLRIPEQLGNGQLGMKLRGVTRKIKGDEVGPAEKPPWERPMDSSLPRYQGEYVEIRKARTDLEIKLAREEEARKVGRVFDMPSPQNAHRWFYH